METKEQKPWYHGVKWTVSTIHSVFVMDHNGQEVVYFPASFSHYADLIAAAPETATQRDELLSVNKQLVEALEEAEGFVDRHSEDWYTAGQDLLKKMRAAILAAKASS